MPLDSAHRGYDYQDLLTAIRFVDVLLGRMQVTHVDEKLVADDVFDDLTVVDVSNRRERVQFKHRDTPGEMPINTFTSGRRDLKLDAVLRSVVLDRDGPAK